MPLDILDPEAATELAAVSIHKRHITDDQLRRFEAYAAEMFTAEADEARTQ
jgi:hypothetical protein